MYVSAYGLSPSGQSEGSEVLYETLMKGKTYNIVFS